MFDQSSPLRTKTADGAGENCDTSRPTTILLAGRQTLFLDGLSRLLEDEEDMRVVAVASTAELAMRAATTHNPDVVLVCGNIDDPAPATIPDMLRKAECWARTVFVGTKDASPRVLELVRLGISAYLPARASHAELKAAIRSVARDSDRVVISLSRDEFRRISSSEKSQLSQLEIQILGMVATAMTNGQIAHRLSMSEAVVKRHLRNIFRRLGAVSRLDAVNKACDARLLVPQRNARTGTSAEGRGP
ncbi:LuxR C-terminal-related transcriptional regulator [Kitasatospora sp. NPDC058218]|uniref:LuxR C-terminal-related transcriptional regulator n=1 Tax=Kitasatospora sp. NPDC058218 TaxID=3346385 RepID=UPI0036DD184A